MAKPPTFALRNAINEAVHLFQSGQIDATQAHCRKALRAYPNSHELLEVLALAYARERNFKRASITFGKIVALGKANRTILVNMARVCFELGSYDMCERLLLKVQEMAPDDHGADMLLGDAMVKQGKLAKALHHYRRATTSPDHAAEALYGIGAIKRAQMDLAGALESERASIALKARGAASAAGLLSLPTEYLTDDDLKLAETLLASGSTDGKSTSEMLHLHALLDYHRGEWEIFAEKIKKVNALKCAEMRKDPSEQPFFKTLNAYTDGVVPAPESQTDEHDPRLLLILGPSTSGKSSLEALHVASPNTVPRYEALSKEAVNRFLKERPKNISMTDALSELFFLNKDDGDLSGKTVIATLPSIIFRMPLLMQILPGLRVISIVKDKTRLTVDILCRYYTSGNAYSFDLPATFEYIESYGAYINRVGKMLGNRFLELQQEEISGDPKSALTRIERLVGRPLGIDPAIAMPRLIYPPAGFYETVAPALGVKGSQRKKSGRLGRT